MWNRITRVVACCVGLILCSPGDAAAFDLAQTRQSLSETIRNLLADTGIPSVSIALLRGDRVVWSDGFGFANVRQRVPATRETLYSTGSCLKPVTAMALLQLVDQGKLGLDDPIDEYLGKAPHVSEGEPPITLRHLLAHYSGLAAPFETVPLWDRRLPKSLEQLASEVTRTERAGSQYRYSNVGYAIAGHVLERVSGESFDEYLVANVLKPTGSKQRGLTQPTPEMIENLALPYRTEEYQSVAEAQYRFDVFPAGDAYLSVDDMARILLLHLNDGKLNGRQVLSRDAIHEMQMPQLGGSSGLDFGIRTIGDSTLIMHGGGVPGYSTKFILDVDAKIGVYVAANAGGAHLPLQILAQMSLDALLDRAPGKGISREVVGIGIVPLVDQRTGDVRIREVLPLSPASEARLVPGSTIRRVNGVPQKVRELQSFLTAVGGPNGTRVELELVHPHTGKAQTTTLTRRPLRVPG